MPNPSNSEYVQHSAELQRRLPKSPQFPLAGCGEKLKFYLQAYRALRGHDLPPHATLLDYGCGYGSIVYHMLDRGFDGYGVDILEYWGKDADHAGEVVHFFPEEITSRLYGVDADSLRLPFPDSTFDLIVSYQVFEHVFDLRPVLREMARVLKPRGVAIHYYPRMLAPIEAHTRLPIAFLSRYRWYLTLWAILGIRHPRQKGLSWRETVTTNEAGFGTTHYITKRAMLALAREAGLDAHFMNHLRFAETRIGRLYRKFDRLGIAGLLTQPLMGVNMNYVLVTEKSLTQTGMRSA
jgi:SAM-dependent methyltransferase